MRPKSSTTNIYAGISHYGITLAHEVSGTTGLKTLIHNKKGHADRNIISEAYGIVMKIPFFKGASELPANEGACL